MQLTATWLGKRNFNWLFFAVVTVTFLVMPITAGFMLREKSLRKTEIYRERPTRELVKEVYGFFEFAVAVGGIPLVINSALGLTLAFLFARKSSKEVDGLQVATDDMIHDLRHPVSNLVEQIELELAKRKEPSKALESMRDSSYWILSVYDMNAEILTNFAGKVAGLKSQKCDAVDVVSEAAMVYKGVVEERGIVFNLLLPEEPLMVTTYWAKFNSLISNIIDNAVKYTEKGSITIRLEKKKKGLKFTVKDTGPGMTEEEAEKVRMNLYRASSSAGKPGMGRGMALINSLALLLKGNFELDPVEGKGTTCTVNLPLDMTRKPSPSPMAWLKITASKLSKSLIFENKEKRGVA